MRILLWNILEGLHRPLKEAAFCLDQDRAERACRLIAVLRPDVVVLNEALWCEAFDEYRMDYAALFGFPYAACSLYDKHWGNAILARKPIELMRTFRIHNRGGLVTRVCGVGIATYHPHPSRRPHMRADDFAALLEGQSGPLVLCGDMNAVSPEDSPDVAALEVAFARFSSKPAQDVARFIKGGQSIFAQLQSLGLRDAMPRGSRTYTIPTDLLTADKTSAMRMDHVWASPDVEVIAGKVLTGPDAELASDHRPVMVDIRVR